MFLGCGSITPVSASVLTWPWSLCLCVSVMSSSYKDTTHVGLGPTLLQCHLVFT